MRDTIGRVLATVVLTSFVLVGTQSCGFLPGPNGPSSSVRPTVMAAPSGSTPAVLGQAPSSAPSPQLLGQDFSTAVRRVAEAVKPAVVQITTSQEPVGSFNQPIPQQTGVGSGVIYDQAGYILTNNHVVAGAQSLTVALPDGRTFDAKLVGADPDTDLAVVQIQGDGNLPVAQLGDSSQMAVGDWVVAIGNALALPGGATVTQGVASALGRSLQEPGNSQSGSGGPFLYDLIQTDAAINPGNSGGALVNLAGQVVGINTLVAGMAEPGVQAQGIGFAISINSAKPIAQQLVANGHVTHPFLGINYSFLTPSVARQLGMQSSDVKGVVVIQVVQASPAAQAGLKGQDVITQVDKQPIVDESTLGKVMSGHQPGDKVTLTVLRGGQSQQITVTLGQAPAGQ
jgi:serine protease Do